MLAAGAYLWRHICLVKALTLLTIASLGSLTQTSCDIWVCHVPSHRPFRRLYWNPVPQCRPDGPSRRGVVVSAGGVVVVVDVVVVASGPVPPVGRPSPFRSTSPTATSLWRSRSSSSSEPGCRGWQRKLPGVLTHCWPPLHGSNPITHSLTSTETGARFHGKRPVTSCHLRIVLWRNKHDILPILESRSQALCSNPPGQTSPCQLPPDHWPSSVSCPPVTCPPTQFNTGFR